MFKEIVDDAQRTPDIGRSQKLTMSTLCSGELTKNDDGSYNDRIRVCILELNGFEVAVEEVSPVIQAVLKHITSAQIPKSELPNRNTVQTIVDQGHFLAKTYISIRIDNCKYWGLHRDGTS